MRDRRAVSSSEDGEDLHINDALFARQRESDSDVRVNVALFSAAKSGTRPIVRRPAPSVPDVRRGAAPARMTWMAIGAAIAMAVAAVSFVLARLLA